MLGKLLALLAHAKAAGVTIVVVAAGATVTVAGTTPEVQDQLQQLTTNIAQLTKSECDSDHGQPEGVAQRNAADKLIRAAWQKDHKALEDLRGGKDVDNQAVGAIVKKYSDLLSTRLDKGINDVAALTLGREGQLKASASPSGSPAPSASPTGSATATPSCTPKPSATATASASPTASPSPSPSPSASGSPAASNKVEGRVTVAERTTLQAAIQAIVDQTIKDMDDLVKKATDEAAKVPAPQRGKPSDNPGNKPSDKGKPSGAPGKP